MLVEDRRKQVLELVKGRGFVTLADLAREVGVSESTARRDLDHWEGRGVLRRVHGGAMSAEDGQGLPALEARANAQVAEKRRIALAAAARVRDGRIAHNKAAAIETLRRFQDGKLSERNSDAVVDALLRFHEGSLTEEELVDIAAALARSRHVDGR